MRTLNGNAAEIHLAKARAALEDKLKVLSHVEVLLTEVSENEPARSVGLWSPSPAMPAVAEAAIMAGLLLLSHSTASVAMIRS